MVIAAAIGGVATIAGGVISSNAAHSAANTAAQTADKNNALQSDIYNKNSANLAPFTARGNVAGDHINALLGLNGDPSQTQPNPLAAPQPGDYVDGIGYGGFGGGFSGGIRNPPAQMSVTAGYSNPVSATTAANAFSDYRGSDGYQFRLGQGIQSVDTGYAAHGALDSGAAMKALDTYGQGAASDEFGKYMGYLQGQQQVGANSANALAGVGQNYANAVSSNNNNAAGAIGSADIAGANAINGGIKNALGLLGASAGSASSYGAPPSSSAVAGWGNDAMRNGFSMIGGT